MTYIFGCVVDSVSESKIKYFNQAYRLVESFRLYAGEISKAKFVICIIGSCIPSFYRAFREFNCDVIECAAIDNSRRKPHLNKFAFYNLECIRNYDAAILLDCDVIVCQDFSSLIACDSINVQNYGPWNSFQAMCLPHVPYFKSIALLFDEWILHQFGDEDSIINKVFADECNCLSNALLRRSVCSMSGIESYFYCLGAFISIPKSCYNFIDILFKLVSCFVDESLWCSSVFYGNIIKRFGLPHESFISDVFAISMMYYSDEMIFALASQIWKGTFKNVSFKNFYSPVISSVTDRESENTLNFFGLSTKPVIKEILKLPLLWHCVSTLSRIDKLNFVNLSQLEQEECPELLTFCIKFNIHSLKYNLPFTFRLDCENALREPIGVLNLYKSNGSLISQVYVVRNPVHIVKSFSLALLNLPTIDFIVYVDKTEEPFKSAIEQFS